MSTGIKMSMQVESDNECSEIMTTESSSMLSGTYECKNFDVFADATIPDFIGEEDIDKRLTNDRGKRHTPIPSTEDTELNYEREKPENGRTKTTTPHTKANCFSGNGPQQPPFSVSTISEKKVLQILTSHGVIQTLPERKGLGRCLDLDAEKNAQAPQVDPQTSRNRILAVTTDSVKSFVTGDAKNLKDSVLRNTIGIMSIGKRLPFGRSSSNMAREEFPKNQRSSTSLKKPTPKCSGYFPTNNPASQPSGEGENCFLVKEDGASRSRAQSDDESTFAIASRLVKGELDDDDDDDDEIYECNESDGNKEDEDEDAINVLLHEIFKRFCTPAPTMEQIAVVLCRCRDDVEVMGFENSDSAGGAKRRISSSEHYLQKKLPHRSQLRRTVSDSSVTGNISKRSLDVKIDTKEGGGETTNASESDEGSRDRGSMSIGLGKPSPVCSLPKDVVISMGEGGTPVARLLSRSPRTGLLQLPIHFQLAFFRILIRLLANEEDDEYDEYIHGLENQYKDSPCEAKFGEPGSNGVMDESYDIPDDDKVGKSSVNEVAVRFHGWEENNELPRSFTSGSDSFSTEEQLKNMSEQNQPHDFPRNERRNSAAVNTAFVKPLPRRWSEIGSAGSAQEAQYIKERKQIGMHTKNSRKKSDNPFAYQRVIAGKANRLYSVVRFRSGSEWNRYCKTSGSSTPEGHGAVAALLDLFRILISTPQQSQEQKYVDRSSFQYQHQYLVAPVARVLSLLCMAGVAVQELRRILDLISLQHHGNLTSLSYNQPYISTVARLHLIRALTYAAEGAANSTRQISKASPRCFFTFGAGKGLAIPPSKPAWPWPFRNEYGFAVWFRAEQFDGHPSSPRPILLSMKTEEGAGIEVSLKVFPSTNNSSDARDGVVSTLVVTVTENGSFPEKSTVAQLQGCVLSPRIWYHVALRHSCPGFKGYFTSARDEFSIFLDGKHMLTEELKFPKILSNKHNGRGSARFGNLEFGKNFDGETGALYIFKEYVSDATLKALYEHTVGAAHMTVPETTDLIWDSFRGELARKANTIYEEMPGDTEELAIPKPTVVDMNSGQSGGNMAPTGVDLAVGDDSGGDSGLRVELSRPFLASKICLVWDPCKISGQIALETHMGAHAQLDSNEVQSWVIDGAKVVIGSIGGVQSLLPLFQLLLVGNKENKADSANRRWVDAEEIYSLVPDLLFLLASFVRNSCDNSREILRCGGVEIIEQCLLENKRQSGMCIVRKSPRIAKLFVDALIDLRDAALHNLALESKIFSRLLFNVPLWLGGISDSPGVALHAALLPMLSSMAKSNPNKVRDCVCVRELLQSINEFTNVDEIVSSNMSTSYLFDRSGKSELPPDTPLTIPERRHVVDVIFGIVVTITAPKTTPLQLNPLLNFISFNLDIEWEKASQAETINRRGSRREKFMAASKACMVLLFLLQSRPIIPQLYESFEECCGDANGVASWILCCMVNSFDDFIRSLGVRCLTAYLDGLAIASSIKYDTSDEPSANILDTNLELSAAVAPTRHFSKGAAAISNTMKYVGTGLGVIANSAVSGGEPINIKVIFKLLWHLLKCHRERLGDLSHAALVHLLVDDGSLQKSVEQSFLMDSIVIPDEILPGGYQINENWSSLPLTQVGIDTTQKLRNTHAIGTILRLMRFLPREMIERWLFDLLALTRVSPNSVKAVLPGRDWQPCLFHLVSEIVEEISCQRIKALKESSTEDEGDSSKNNNQSSAKKNPKTTYVEEELSSNSGHISADHQIAKHEITDQSSSKGFDQEMNENISSHNDSSRMNDDQESKTKANSTKATKKESAVKHSVAILALESRVGTRFDLALKLFSILLGHCVRQGGDKAYQAVEQAASLQRVCVNGHEVFCILLSHLLNELTDSGTVANISSVSSSPSIERNRALKQSANVVTNAILSNGSSDMDLSTAVKHWRCLRHLTAITLAVVTKSGYCVSDLFDYRNHDASAVDSHSGGLHGIRLPDGTISGLGALESVAGAKKYSASSSEDEMRARKRQGYRMMCVTLSSQLLSLLDAFIFPDSLDTSLPASQLHGLALVRSTEPRLGQAQGPLLASLLRLSLVLLSHLEPSSVKFLQCCGRLRCFLHWALELIRESVALGGYSAAFQELTAPLDRLVLAVVLQCHRALAKCSNVLKEIESSPSNKYFSSSDLRQKNYRRLFRATFELREIVLAAYRGRNEVLRSALSLQAYEALQAGLEEITAPNRQKGGVTAREASLRAFMTNSWVQGFHDVEIKDDLAIPEQVSNGQMYRGRLSSTRGCVAIEELAFESASIIDEYNRALDSPFEKYCEDQRQWAETDAVRDLEYEGDLSVKRLGQGHRNDLVEINRLASLRADSAANRWDAIDRLSSWVDYYAKNSDNLNVRHWKLSRHVDRLHRRILLVPNRHYVSHDDASYEGTLGRERERNTKRLSAQTLRQARKSFYDDVADIDNEDPDDNIEEYGEISSRNNDAQNDSISSGMEKPTSEIEENEGMSGRSDSETASDWDQALTASNEALVDDIDSDEKDANAWAKSFIWSAREHIVQSFDSVLLVTLRSLTEGQLLLTTHNIYFHPTEDEINVMTREKMSHPSKRRRDNERRDKRWRLSRLTEVHGRRYMLRAQALELFFADAQELFINFNGGAKIRDNFYAKLRHNCKVPMLRSPKSLAPRSVFKRSRLTELWRRRKISNFQYIMELNIMAGRTFNDLTQYPVFPWVLSDYTSETLDLNNSLVFRDLSKPVGALNPDRLAQLIDRYHNLDGFKEEEKFLYGSHYSSPAAILHYMIRQEPFTTMSIELQSGRFDCPDRLFNDIAGCWRCCLTLTSDVKELIPEFFTCPEMFLNTNNLAFGETQDSIQVDNVILPPWANGSAHEFVRIHRLALESEYVSQNLHHWIDLIFGFKQRGPEAVAAHNVFHFLSYEGSVDLDSITDEIDRKATESHIQNFGQTPSQLIPKESHVQRSPSEEAWRPLCSEISRLRQLRCWTAPKQFGVSEACGAVLSIHVLTDQIIVIYADLSVGSYKWSLKHNGRAPFVFRMDKLKTLSSRTLSVSPTAICGSALSDDTSISSASAKDRANEVAKQLERERDCGLAVGSWSFGMTIRCSFKDSVSRKSNSSSSRAMEGSINMDASVSLLSCGYWDDTVKIHTLDGFKLKCSASGGHRGPINCLSVGDHSGLMVTGGHDATCRIWVVDNPDMAAALTDAYVQTSLGNFGEREQERLLSCCHVLWGHISSISCIALSTDLDVVVSGSVDGLICIHSVRKGKFVRSLRVDEHEECDGHSKRSAAVRKLALSSNGIFVAHMDNRMLHLCTINGVKLSSVDAGDKLHAMEICSGGEMLITGGDSCYVVIRSLRDLGVRCVLDLSSHGPIRCISLTPAESNPAPQFMYIGTNDGMVTVVDVDPNEESDNCVDEGLPQWSVHDGRSKKKW